MLSKVLLPAPDGPMIAVSSPDLNVPFRLSRIFLLSEINVVIVRQVMLYCC